MPSHAVGDLAAGILHTEPVVGRHHPLLRHVNRKAPSADREGPPARGFHRVAARRTGFDLCSDSRYAGRLVMTRNLVQVGRIALVQCSFLPVSRKAGFADNLEKIEKGLWKKDIRLHGSQTSIV